MCIFISWHSTEQVLRAGRDAAPHPPPPPAAPGCTAAWLGGRGGSRTEEGRQDAVLSGPAGGDPGADVRAPVGGSHERLPPRLAAGAARQTQRDLPDHRADPERQEDPPPGQPPQRVPLGVQVRAEVERNAQHALRLVLIVTKTNPNV